MNWYQKQKTYQNFRRLASYSTDMKAVDLGQWARFHIYMANILGFEINDEIDLFMDLSKIIQELSDQLNRFPKPEEVISIWDKVHPGLI